MRDSSIPTVSDKVSVEHPARVTGEIRPPWHKRIKRWIKPYYLRGKVHIAQTFYGYGIDKFDAALGRVGIGMGDALMLHSSFAKTSGFRGRPAEFIECLLSRLGDDGHLLMLSMAYGGSSERYVSGDPLFDVCTSPSALGVMSELFRRRPDVLRSLNPLHPVLAHGPLAAWLTIDHEKIPRSCGAGSPFERLLTLHGKFLFIDAPFGALTFMHFVEDLLRDSLPVALYGETPATVRIRDREGGEHSVRQYYFSAAARDRRNFAKISTRLEQGGHFRRTRVGRTELLCVDAAPIVVCAQALCASGEGFYR